jgi:hypothetical protein
MLVAVKDLVPAEPEVYFKSNNHVISRNLPTFYSYKVVGSLVICVLRGAAVDQHKIVDQIRHHPFSLFYSVW